MVLKTFAKTSLRAAALAALCALAGCGMDDIQLNGKLFDAVGLNNTGSVKKEATLKERAPLVVPPGLDKLPVPGSEVATENAAIAEVKDYDATRKTTKDDLARQQAAYCKVHYEDARSRGDNDADLATGPMGPCRPSVFSAIKTWNDGSGEPEEAQ